MRFSRPGLVANDALSSTAVFIGTGPVASGGAASVRPAGVDSLSPPAPRVLYVASTYVPAVQGPRDALDVPALASLTLEQQRLFEFTAQSISSGTFMKLDYRRMPFFK